MADDATVTPTGSTAPEAAASVPDTTDEAVSEASGLRATSKWIAGAFAGIPSLAVIGALVRAPGDAGFEAAELIFGVSLAAAGAYLGIRVFANVMAPAALTDRSITNSVMDHLPEARFSSYADLRKRLEEERNLVGQKQVLADDAAAYSAAAEAQAAQAETSAKLADELLGEKEPLDPDKKAEAKAARAEARRLRTEAGVVAASSKLADKELESHQRILGALESLRRGAYALQAGETVRKRFADAQAGSMIAVGLVAAGVILLALAPKPKAEEPAAATAATSLVTLTPNEAGKTALGCDADTVEALKVGGTAESPTVIVLPGGGCEVKTVQFALSEPTPLGTVEDAKPVTGESAPAE
jgi:hypothetical protein